MAAFLGKRIIDCLLDYKVAVIKRPDLKTGIDAYLAEKGREDLIAA